MTNTNDDESVLVGEDFKETDSFAKMRALKPGWYDGEGEVITPIALEHGVRIRDLLASKQIECCVFPTIEGGVSIEETEDSDLSFSITIHPDGSAVVSSFDDHEAEEEHPDAKDLPSASEWMSKVLLA